ncbi:MAG: dienelactone hydrolase family protein [Verrucomicrobia bacterium]|nr:dienelactone hydrolase family protein [Verrucomicrobiota bacterium]
MSRLPLLLLLAALTAAPLLFATEAQTVQAFERTVSRTIGYRYLLHLPQGYEAQSGRAWPLLVFLHGAGERGADPWLVAKHGPPKLLRSDSPASKGETAEAAARRATAARLLATEFIVISPQCSTGQKWDDEAVLALIEEVSTRHRVDRQRLYLTGLSMGGFGTWSLALKHPAKFAAVAPICGGGLAIDLIFGLREHKAATQSLGFWVFHGAKDPVVLLNESERLVEGLRKGGVKELRFTVYPEALHDSWTESYANPDLYTWMLQHRRN